MDNEVVLETAGIPIVDRIDTGVYITPGDPLIGGNAGDPIFLPIPKVIHLAR